MTETVRVRDEDYRRVQFIRDVTGLSSAEAVHYLFRSGHLKSENFRERVRTDLYAVARLYHPRWDDDMPDEAKRELVAGMELNNAGELMQESGAEPGTAVTIPRFK
jgi:hypothetical protein